VEILHILFGLRGRIDRLAYWLATVLKLTVLVVVSKLATVANQAAPNYASLSPAESAALMPTIVGMLLWLLVLLLCLGCCLWWGFAISVKRWHDRGKSGTWVLINLIPIVGALWQFVECGCLPGTPGPNPYGRSTGVAETAAVFS